MNSLLFILPFWRWPFPPAPVFCADKVCVLYTAHSIASFESVHPCFSSDKKDKSFSSHGHSTPTPPPPHSSMFFFFILVPELRQRHLALFPSVPAHLFTHHSGCSITITAIVALGRAVHLLFTPFLLLCLFHYLLFAFSLELREKKKGLVLLQFRLAEVFLPPSSFFFMVISLQISAVSGKECCQVV